MIEVKPNWHDSTELLGYYSSFNGGGYKFTKFDKFVVKAWLNPDVPFFVCLDEMNLAPVEQYFAEFLSVLETRSRDSEGYVVTGALVDKKYFNKDDTKMKTKFGLEKDGDWTIKVRSDLENKGLTLPPNLIVIGTVNMDDTTYQFSRKVIDRAMTIEMNGGELSQMFGNSNSLKYRSDEDVVKLGMFKAPYINADEVIERYQSQANTIKEKLPEKLEAVNTALKDTPFQVSYRVLNELVIYLGALMDEATAKGEAIDDDALPTLIDQAMDQITLMKILPRIEGDEDMFRRSGGTNVLKTLQSLFSEDTDSYRKLKEMIDRLDRTGFTRFWP
jgi:5-methylcytosine-specific restriction endonuclease McrBC GTP-binding regulatory subunit McrB